MEAMSPLRTYKSRDKSIPNFLSMVNFCDSVILAFCGKQTCYIIISYKMTFAFRSMVCETIPAYFSPLQLREKGFNNPVEGKKAHGRVEKERESDMV